MESNIDFLRAILDAKISLRHLVKVIDYIEANQDRILTRKEATRDLKIKPSVWSRAIMLLLQYRVIRVELAEDLKHRKFYLRGTERTENIIPEFQNKDSWVPKTDPLSTKNGTTGYQKEDSGVPKTGLLGSQIVTSKYQKRNSDLPEIPPEDTQVANTPEPEKGQINSGKEALQKQDLGVLEGELGEPKNGTQGCQIWDSRVPKMGLKGTENGTPETLNCNHTDPTKERKEKRTKKEKKENISFILEKEKEKEKENNTKEKEREKERPTLPTWIPIETWNAYVEMRKKIKHPLTDFAVRLYQRAFERLKQHGISEAEIIEAIETSIAKGWLGIFVRGTDVLKLKPERILPTQSSNETQNQAPVPSKQDKELGGVPVKEYYSKLKNTYELLRKEAEQREPEKNGDVKPVGTLIQNLIGQLGAKKPTRDERLKTGWGVKTYASGFV